MINSEANSSGHTHVSSKLQVILDRMQGFEILKFIFFYRPPVQRPTSYHLI